MCVTISSIGHLTWRIFQNEGGEFVPHVNHALITASFTRLLDDALLIVGEEISLGVVTFGAKNVFADEPIE